MMLPIVFRASGDGLLLWRPPQQSGGQRMPKEKQKKKGSQLRHSPIGQAYEEQPLKNRATHPKFSSNEGENEGEEELETIPEQMQAKIFNQAREQRMEMVTQETSSIGKKNQMLSKQAADGDDSEYDVSLLCPCLFSILLLNESSYRMMSKKMKRVRILSNMTENMSMEMI
jgi:hypothetical protein